MTVGMSADPSAGMILEIVVPASSSPISAMIGPIAAAGKTMFIHFVPQSFIMIATTQNSNPETTNPP